VETPSSTNRWDIARVAVGIFFPQRPVLKIDGHGYSPTILHRILHLVGATSSFDVAATALLVVGEIAISDRQINKLTTEMGGEMAADRDARTRRYVEQPLPRRPTTVEQPLDLAAVFCDGGRMRTRAAEQGRGVHQPHWRETKNAGFHRMQSRSFREDPQPDLPDCFCNQAYVEKLVKGLKCLKSEGREESEEQTSTSAAAETTIAQSPSWQPETLFRTCLSSLASSHDFGAMMAAEADSRGFFTARKKAFLGDGSAYNWNIQQSWFPGFVPVADFVHAVEYVYTAAKAIHHDAAAWWRQYLAWANACWQGRVHEVIAELQDWETRLGPPRPGGEIPDEAPCQIVHATARYLTNNSSRMDYPRYRKMGLPVTSSLAESLVKQISRRVKGTEKFWNDGPSGESILQVRAAVISDGNRLSKWTRNRPVSPFSPRCQRIPQANKV
jgi:hypothetical protein